MNRSLKILILISIIFLLNLSPKLLLSQQTLVPPDDELTLSSFYYFKTKPSEEGFLAKNDIGDNYFKQFQSEEDVIKLKKDEKNNLFIFKSYFNIDGEKNYYTNLCLYISNIEYPFNIYINGKLIYRTKQQPYKYLDGNAPYSIYIPPEYLNYKHVTNILTFEIFTYIDNDTNMIFPIIKILKESKANWMIFWNTFLNQIYVRGVSFVSVILFLYFIFLFVKRNFKDLRYIYFSLLCLFFTLAFIMVTFYQTSTNELILLKISRISFPITLYLSLLLIMEQTGVLSKSHYPQMITGILTIFTTTIFILQNNIQSILQIYFYILNFIMFPILIFDIILLIYSLITKKKGKRGEFIILIGFLIASFTAVIDVFEYNMEIQGINFTPFGFSILMICIFFVLAIEQSQALQDKENTQKILDRLTFNIHNSLKNKLESAKHLMDYYIQSNNKSLYDLTIVKNLIDHSSKESKNILFVLKNSECSIKTFNDELKMRTELTLMPDGINFKFSTNRNDDKTILRSENIQCILGIYSELMNNIVKHSKANYVTITIHYLDNQLEIMVHDNGIGFDVEKMKYKYGSYGLSLIEDNIDDNCCFKIISHIDKGTKAKIKINRPYI